MKEKAIETSSLKIPPKARFVMGKTVRFTHETVKDIELIAAYEHMKPAELMRWIICEKIRVYKRNPGFKQFLKKLRDMQEAKKSE